MPKRKYLTINGKVITYTYLVSEMNHKPKCDNCGYRMKKVYHRYINGGIRDNIIGYICEKCNIVIILNKYILLRGEMK